MMPGLSWLCVPGLLSFVLLAVAPAQAHLYGPNDLVVSLANGADSILLNSSSAWFAQFFASWCGHCQHFKPTFQALAQEIKDWRPAVYLAVLDCGDEANSIACKQFEIQGFPTLKVTGLEAGKWRCYLNICLHHISAARDPKAIKKMIIDTLEAKKESPPPACPPLEPISTAEVDQFFQNNDEGYLVLIFELPDMYMAREVSLDMVQYGGVSVRRVLNEQDDLVSRFNVSSFPSGFLLSRNGSISRLKLEKESRKEYTSFIRSLPGVNKLNLNIIGWSGIEEKNVTLRPANSSKIYMADLESSLHYSLRVEVARFTTLEGERLKALGGYIKMLSKYFPARPMLHTLLTTLSDWLSTKEGESVSYEDFANVLNNRNNDKDAVLVPHVNFVWCQGSKSEYRGFPCTVWTLFHLLTVQAFELRDTDSDPQEVLQTMRHYIRYFFGCRACAIEFEKMASESMSTIRDHDEAIRWLWSSHNRVNKRLAGNKQEDPLFPKIQWPSKDLCPKCRRKILDKEIWDGPYILRFLKQRFSESNIAYEYLEDETELLKKQREVTSTNTTREKRETKDVIEEQETPSRNDNIIPPVKAEEEGKVDTHLTTKAKQIPRHRPTIIKMKSHTGLKRDKEEKILDLDAYENHYFQGRTLQDSNSKLHKRALHPKILLDPSDADFNEEAVRERLLKRGIDTQYLIGVMVNEGDSNWKGRWVKMLEVGFSRLDISLCIILYFLTSMGLLAMYLYLNVRSRFFRQRCRYAQP
ncbi:PREDICTED: sulfhydryl oxidase 1 [Nanorana parkeri]|uniref:sulfhydryl oxidase 1 n=1 Tax=Nanorana parkeri TaxID=125878 RepID=UPI000854C3B7|nr:PREDICTED: sulfhydryl oxidase 1 [Nanorana parkeri]